MPPPIEKAPEPEPAKKTPNFFQDIYAQEMSRMQSTAKTSAVPKKKHFDASQFNAYGLPLGLFLITFIIVNQIIIKDMDTKTSD